MTSDREALLWALIRLHGDGRPCTCIEHLALDAIDPNSTLLDSIERLESCVWGDS